MLVVYWIDCSDKFSSYEEFTDSNDDLLKALKLCSELRQQGHLCVTSVYHTSEIGGIVSDNKLPNGQDYTWKKRR